MSIALLCIGTAIVLAGCNGEVPTQPKAQNGKSTAKMMHDQHQKVIANADKKPAEAIAALSKEVSKLAHDRVKNASNLALKADAEAFNKELENVIKELNEWAVQVEALRQSGKPVTAENIPKYPTIFTVNMAQRIDRSTGTDPTKPVEQTSEEQKKQDDEQLKTLMTLAAAALCVYQPQLCPFVMAFITSMGGSADDVKRDSQMLKDVEAATQTGNFDDDLIERMAKKFGELSGAQMDPSVLKKLRDLPREFAEDNDPINDRLSQAMLRAAARSEQAWEKIRHEFPKWVSDMVQQLTDIKPEREICRAFTQRDQRGPYFTDKDEKRLMEIAVSWAAERAATKGGPSDLKLRYWDNLLGKIGLQEDVNRVDPCKENP